MPYAPPSSYAQYTPPIASSTDRVPGQAPPPQQASALMDAITRGTPQQPGYPQGPAQPTPGGVLGAGGVGGIPGQQPVSDAMPPAGGGPPIFPPPPPPPLPTAPPLGSGPIQGPAGGGRYGRGIAPGGGGGIPRGGISIPTGPPAGGNNLPFPAPLPRGARHGGGQGAPNPGGGRTGLNLTAPPSRVFRPTPTRQGFAG